MNSRKRRLVTITTSSMATTTTIPTSALIRSATSAIGGLAAVRNVGNAHEQSGVDVDTHTLPTNVFLTICDENSNESQEYIEFDKNALTTHIKLEEDQDVLTQPIALQPPTLQSAIEYRIVNPLQQQQQHLQLQQQHQVQRELVSAASLLPASVQLPSGCEIYLLKQCTGAPSVTLSSTSSSSSSSPSSLSSSAQCNHNIHMQQRQKNKTLDTMSAAAATTTAATTVPIKVDIDAATQSPNMFFVSAMECSDAAIQSLAPPLPPQLPALVNNATTAIAAATTTTTTRAAATTTTVAATTHPRSLEAYKKRDDKRRATHNEVERRRRDKINQWIFKLKEMLPGGSANSNCIATTTTKLTSNGGQNGRSPANDSKSQILIKACDYIKMMQTELNSLRECLKENENLRLKNQRLETELDLVRQQLEEQQNRNSMPSSSSFVTLNALNSSGDLFGGIDATSTIDFNKRELIIGMGDYVE